jgi:hypothetical protein
MLSNILLTVAFAAGLSQALPQPTAVPNAATPVLSETTAAPQPRQASTNLRQPVLLLRGPQSGYPLASCVSAPSSFCGRQHCERNLIRQAGLF